MDEAELQREVGRLLRARPRLAWHHCRRSDACDGGPGWPDLIIAGRGVLYRELKGDTTRMTLAQTAVRAALALAGCDYGIWRPDDLASGRIEKELDELTGEWHGTDRLRLGPAVADPG